MRRRYVVSLGAVAGVLALVPLAMSLFGQSPATPAKSTAKSTATKSATATKAGATLRTAWGDPDLQGTWFVMADVPLERSAANANKEFLTDEEMAAAGQTEGPESGAQRALRKCGPGRHRRL